MERRRGGNGLSEDEEVPREGRMIRLESSEEEQGEDDDDDDDDNERSEDYNGALYSIANAGFCDVCQLTTGEIGPGGATTNYEHALSRAPGHLLCHRCVRRFAIRSDDFSRGTTESSRPSASTDSRESGESPDVGYAGTRRLPERAAPPTAVNEASPDPRTRSYPSVSGFDNGAAIESRSEWEIEAEDRAIDRGRRRVATGKEEANFCTESINGGTSECSRRPIRCPRLDCAVNVAYSSLAHHFLFDHPEVPILRVAPGDKSTLVVGFTALSCDASRCLALLLVSGKLSGPAARLFNGNQIQSNYRNRLPLPVLAARLHHANNYAIRNELDSCEGGDVIIAWVAGLDVGNVTSGGLRCSIQVVDNASDEHRSLTYTGPVNSLRTAQLPREVFLTGDCVVLHEGLSNRIASGHTDLSINVIVH